MRILIKLLLALPAIAATTAPALAQPGHSLPHAIVYKTSADIKDLVAVQLSVDGSKISSYPAPTDVAAQPAPVKLGNGYWLSKAGVSERTAFLRMTRKEYSQLKDAPPATELFKMIKERNPMTELWDCGIQGEVSEKTLKDVVRKKQLAKKCKRIK